MPKKAITLTPDLIRRYARQLALLPAAGFLVGGWMWVVQGELTSGLTEWPLSDELVIGRDPGCDIPFADGSVSRRHSRVFLANDVVYIEDLGSQNGTCVNGERITTARQLRSGDTVSIGDAVFRLRF